MARGRPTRDPHTRPAILAAEGIEATKADAQTVDLAIQHSLRNHEGKGGVEIVGEARPATWRVHTN